MSPKTIQWTEMPGLPLPAGMVTHIVIHCSASRNDGLDIEDVHRWHGSPKPRGRGWAGCGYHYVIPTSGVIQVGRPLNRTGAHVGHRRWNTRAIGVCLMGMDPEHPFTVEQKRALWPLVDVLCQIFDVRATNVVGHRDLSPDLDGDGKVERHEWLKTCPTFDVGAEYARWLNGERP